MVNKNVKFRDSSMEKSPSPKRFQEPEGMTNIDLRRLSAIQSKLFESTKYDPRLVRKKIFKLIAMVAIICLACSFIIIVFPRYTGTNQFKSAWNNFINNNDQYKLKTNEQSHELTKIIELYMDKLQICKITKTFDDCCVIFSEVESNISLEDCTVERVINSILNHETSLLEQYPKFLKDSASVINNSPLGIQEIEIINDYNYDDSYEDFENYDFLENALTAEKFLPRIEFSGEFSVLDDKELKSTDELEVINELFDPIHVDRIEEFSEGNTDKFTSSLLNTYLSKLGFAKRSTTESFETQTTVKSMDVPKLENATDLKVGMTDTLIKITNPQKKKTKRHISGDRMGIPNNQFEGHNPIFRTNPESNLNQFATANRDMEQPQNPTKMFHNDRLDFSNHRFEEHNPKSRINFEDQFTASNRGIELPQMPQEIFNDRLGILNNHFEEQHPKFPTNPESNRNQFITSNSGFAQQQNPSDRLGISNTQFDEHNLQLHVNPDNKFTHFIPDIKGFEQQHSPKEMMNNNFEEHNPKHHINSDTKNNRFATDQKEFTQSDNPISHINSEKQVNQFTSGNRGFEQLQNEKEMFNNDRLGVSKNQLEEDKPKVHIHSKSNINQFTSNNKGFEQPQHPKEMINNDLDISNNRFEELNTKIRLNSDTNINQFPTNDKGFEQQQNPKEMFNEVPLNILNNQFEELNQTSHTNSTTKTTSDNKGFVEQPQNQTEIINNDRLGISSSRLEENGHKLRINSESKISQFTSGNDVFELSQNQENSANGLQRQCISTYNPPVSSAVPIIQQQMPYTQFIRNPNNPFIISQPQYTYIPSIQQTIPQSYNQLYANTPNTNPFQVSSQSGQYYMCSIVPTSNSNNAGQTNIVAGLPGVEVRKSSSPFQFQIVGSPLHDKEEKANSTSRASNSCPFGEEMCSDNSKCIHSRLICNGEVNCGDASDEAFCECKARLEQSRICDGYTDCSDGEDEIGCFGCDADSFNCDDWSRVREATCIPIERRCDGIRNCPTGKDELDCSVLTEKLGISDQLFKFSNNVGFLHRNYQGKWYPACSNTEMWAIEACAGESGNSHQSPLTHMIHVDFDYGGPYINADVMGDHDIVSTCVQDRAVYVECPPPTCGLRRVTRNPFRPEEVDTSQEEILTRFRSRREEDNSTDILGDSRVVGGRACQPAAWPWVVSIYRNGIFHCGGALISDSWLLTAAHCVDKYWQFYYEVEAGMLRRFSYSPMEQTRFVSHVVPHASYDRANLKNDIALMRLSAPVIYNRYIKPICLPTEFTAGRTFDKGPPAGTICTAVGWGAMREHGNDPDQLREVEVPILASCKHKEDADGNEICAGLMEGGKDACQGDSGGPFMCRNPNFPEQWYLAGIVSHGEGCARPNEPGVYTRVGLYRNWIYDNAKDEQFPARAPLKKCPGYTCKVTKKCISKKRICDKIVDCLNGDDEMRCETAPTISNLLKHVMRHHHLSLLGSAPNITNWESTITDNEGIDTTPEPNRSDTDYEVNTNPSNTFANQDIIITDSSSKPIELGEPMNNVATAPPTLAVNVSSFASRDRQLSDGNGHISNEQASTTSSSTTNTANEQQAVDNSFREPNKFATAASETLGVSDQSTIAPRTNETQDKDNIITNVARKSNATEKAQFFVCKIMLEIVAATARCNKIVDCQDGTDEKDCSCREYLQNTHPTTICDGITDCKDLSDELLCDTCNDTEFYCRVSKMCIPGEYRCNSVMDCPEREDESDCIALSDHYNLRLDEDLRPQLTSTGMITYNRHGIWRPLCGNFSDIEAAVAGDVCTTLGFTDYIKYFQMPVSDLPIQISATLATRSAKTTNLANDLLANDTDDVNQCTAMYLKCANTSIESHHYEMNRGQQGVNIWNRDVFYTFPWNVAVYVDGDYQCTGVLIELRWVLTSLRCFPEILKLDRHYVSVLAGAGRRHLHVGGPHEQVLRVVEARQIGQTDAIVLRLHGTGVTYTRYARPVLFEKRSDLSRNVERCLALGIDNNSILKTIRLTPEKNCTSPGLRCFKRSNSTIPEELCKDLDTIHPWSGTIICESDAGFYPAAVFHEVQGICGFSDIQGFTSISMIKGNIFKAIEQAPFIVQPPNCDGFRCQLGQCIDKSLLCNGVPNCRDGNDEIPDYCNQEDFECHLHGTCACSLSELRCANGNCIEKSKFCDRINDCGDGSDEPDRCNCLSYLNLADPGKVCDGTRNCQDKSDENPEICQCNAGHFKCKGTRYCIPGDMVCDGQMDCPSNDDEAQCISLQSSDQNPRSGEVVTRTAGIWHSGCFPRHLTTLQLEDICRKLGFEGSSVFYLQPPDGNTTTARRPVLDPFSVVWIHKRQQVSNKLKLAMRSGRKPFVSFVEDANCHKLYIQCL